MTNSFTRNKNHTLTLTCENQSCGATFRRQPKEARKNKHHYCSPTCSAYARRKPSNEKYRQSKLHKMIHQVAQHHLHTLIRYHRPQVLAALAQTGWEHQGETVAPQPISPQKETNPC